MLVPSSSSTKNPRRTSQQLVMFVVTVALLAGCSTVRVAAPGHPGVTDRSDVVWSYAWGLVPAIIDPECQGQPIAEVTVTSSFGFDLLAVVTLGLVAPRKVEWKCAGATPSGGTIGGTIGTTSPASEGWR